MTEHVEKNSKRISQGTSMGTTRFPIVLTYIGAAIYFVQQSNGQFFEVVLALLQALVWPVYVVYHVLQLLGA